LRSEHFAQLVRPGSDLRMYESEEAMRTRWLVKRVPAMTLIATAAVAVASKLLAYVSQH